MGAGWGICWTGQSGHILHGREFSWQRCLGTFKVHILDASPSLFVQNFKGQQTDPRPHRDPVPPVQNPHHSSRRTSIPPHLLWSIPATHSGGHKDHDEQNHIPFKIWGFHWESYFLAAFITFFGNNDISYSRSKIFGEWLFSYRRSFEIHSDQMTKYVLHREGFKESKTKALLKFLLEISYFYMGTLTQNKYRGM